MMKNRSGRINLKGYVQPDTQRYVGRLSLASLVGLFFLLLLQPASASAATVTVTGTGDTIAVDAVVTLREAITSMNQASNVNADVVAVGAYGTNDTINFNIAGAGVKTINVTATPLPTITKPLIINGYTQGVASVNTLANADNAVIFIELNGTSAGAGSNGLILGAGSGGSTISGLTINRFAGNGIVVQSNGNTIIGNFVGTNPTGTTRSPNGTFPNSGYGIMIQSSSNNLIGSTSLADRNVTSGNALDGILIIGTVTAPATGNIVQNNFVGVAADGKSSVGNRTEPAPAPSAAEGNNLFGIEISGGNNNTIGGTVASARNVVGLNGAGIQVNNGGQSNTIQGNYAGVGADGVTPAGNLLNGIVVRSSNGFGVPLGPAQPNEPGASFNLIGGTTAGAGNLVEFNGTGGIAIYGNPVSASGQANIGNAIKGNSVFLNGRNYLGASSSPLPLLGIDLTNGFTFPRDDGFTANDSKGHGTPSAPNNFQNFPVLTSATSSGGTTNITGTLNSAPNSMFRVEFFASDPDPLGLPAEGQQFLGSANALTDANGNAILNSSLSVSVSNGRIVTATATDAIGNTSEFSVGVVVPTQATPPTISINDVAVFEGNAGSANAVFTVTLSAASVATVTVDFTTANGSAAAPVDYTTTPGTLTFASGQTSKTISVPVIGDTLFEPDETFFVNLANPVNATISRAQGVGTILNDDPAPPPPGISINNVAVTEGNSGSINAVFTLTLSATSPQTVAVDVFTSNGTATAPVDYQSVAGTLTFLPGVTTATLSVPVNGDTTPEGNETFFVNLTNAVNATIATPKGTGTINDDDATSIFQFSSATASVAENASPGSATVTVTRTGDTTGAASVKFETSDGTARQRTDYTFGSGTVSFGPGEVSKDIKILIVNDVFVEGAETFQVNLSNPSGNSAVGGLSSILVTITDDDIGPAANPINGAAFFVRQQYLDFLGREPDATGLTFWTANITSCGADAACVAVKRVDTSAAFFLSTEFQETSGNVLRTQRVAFGRQSSDQFNRVSYLQFMRDTRQVGQGVVIGQPGADVLLEGNKQFYAEQTVLSSDFTLRFPPAPGPVYVDALFASAGVTPTAGDRTAAINAFGAGGTTGRINALRSVVDSNSVRQAEFSPSFVLAEYFGYLRRNPTDAPDLNDSGYQFWLTKMNTFNGDFRQADMVKAFISSTEYVQRFGP